MAGKKRALISVYDKTGVVEAARRLVALGYSILSTGGTAETLRSGGIPTEEIAHYTGHPEILEGRVKTLHPRVHGGILADPAKETHRADLERTGIELISLVFVNLYPFREVAARPDTDIPGLIEMIDIGGPTMVRAAAKNHRHVGVVVDPVDYGTVLDELEKDGVLREETRVALAIRAFAHTAAYDAAIRDELTTRIGRRVEPARTDGDRVVEGSFRPRMQVDMNLVRELRYGENPHQRGALYAETGAGPETVAGARQLQGKELSFNNLLDLDAAWRLVLEFDDPAVAIIKHSNPCGVAVADTLREAFLQARKTDPSSAFGGIVAFNRELDAEAAGEMRSLFLECVIAPAVSQSARDLLGAKPNLRVLEASGWSGSFSGVDVRRVTGGYLVQDWDNAPFDIGHARVVTRRSPGADELRALDFAWKVAKHTKSNAIILANGTHSVGIGAGQMSRVDSVNLALTKAQEPTVGAVLASDAFFPFRDGLDVAACGGITAVIQPGGSVKDAEVIAAADEHGMAMVLTGTRHFRH